MELTADYVPDKDTCQAWGGAAGRCAARGVDACRTRQMRYFDDANLDEANYRRRFRRASVCSLSTRRRRRRRRRRRGHATSIRALLFRRIVAPARLSRPQSWSRDTSARICMTRTWTRSETNGVAD
jgi:uncharacterized protein with von Willebrand factor type A (vWA) domain